MTRITEDLIEKYRIHLISEEKSEATVKKYVHDVCVFAEWIDNREVDKALVLEYKKYLIDNYAPTSVNSIISSLNSFFVYNECYNLRVKILKIQRQIFANRDKEISKEEYQRLLTVAKNKGNKKLYLVMQTICACGIRVSELKFITIEALKNMKANINLKGKIRVVIIPDSLCKALLKYAKSVGISEGPVFVSRYGKPLDRSNIWKAMKSLCESANVAAEKVFPHNLRHLFARTFYSIQKDVVRLADILGHTSINTTRLYTMETGEIHRQLIQKLGLLRC